MNFKDYWATDKDGNKFIFTVEMQRQLSEAGLPIEPASLAHIKKQTSKGNRVKSEREVENSIERPASTEDFDEPDSIQIDPNTGKYIGRVKWYNFSKGYGFIARGGGEDIFFHKSDVVSDPNRLDQGAWILYDVEETKKGLEANEVELYESSG